MNAFTITHSHPNRWKCAVGIVSYTSDVLLCVRETKCVCACVWVFERGKRSRNHTPAVILCVTTGQNLIARLLSRWAAGVIGLSSRLSCPLAPRMTADRRGFRRAKHWVSQHSRHGWEAKHMPEEKRMGAGLREVCLNRNSLRCPHLLFALDWCSCSIPNNRFLSKPAAWRQALLLWFRACFSAAKLCASQGRCLMNAVWFICSFYLMWKTKRENAAFSLKHLSTSQIRVLLPWIFDEI